MSPFSFTASLAKNKGFAFKEAMQQPDKKYFIKAMVTEAEAHGVKKTLVHYSKVSNKTRIGDYRVNLVI